MNSHWQELVLALLDAHEERDLSRACADVPDPEGLLRACFTELARREGLELADLDMSEAERELAFYAGRAARGRELTGTTPLEYLYGSFSRPLDVPARMSTLPVAHFGPPADDLTAWSYLRRRVPLSDADTVNNGLTLLSRPQAHLAPALEAAAQAQARPLTAGETWLLTWHRSTEATGGAA